MTKTDIHAQLVDHWVWTGNSNGLFSFRSAWNICRSEGQVSQLHKLIWFPGHCPKMKIFLLRALSDKLLTKDRLHLFGVVQANCCVLCNEQPESIGHLCFDCIYSRYIWALCKLILGLSQQISNPVAEATLIQNSFTAKLKVFVVIKFVLGGAT